jgi:hypothetical protein
MVLRGRDYEDVSWIGLDKDKILWWDCVLKSQISLNKWVTVNCSVRTLDNI